MDVWLDAMSVICMPIRSGRVTSAKSRRKPFRRLSGSTIIKRMARKAVDQYCGNIE